MLGRGEGALGQFKMVEGDSCLKKVENHCAKPYCSPLISLTLNL